MPGPGRVRTALQVRPVERRHKGIDRPHTEYQHGPLDRIVQELKAGGRASLAALKLAYQQADETTMLPVVLERAELREVPAS